MQEQDRIQLTLFQEDFPANLFPWLESKKERGMTVTFGRKCSELSEKLSRLGYLVRTYLESSKLPGEQFVRTWSVRDTLSPFLIMKLRLSEQSTDENGCSLWPTPTSGRADQQMSPSQEMRHTLNLAQTVQVRAGLWPTPTSRDYKDGSAESCKNVSVNGLLGRAIHQLKEQGAITEDERRQMSQGNGGQLNPTWVESLMGFPLNWTRLED